ARPDWPRARAAAALALAAALVAARTVGLHDLPEVQTFTLIFTSIVVEALPFVALGAAVSALIEFCVPAAAFGRVARLPPLAQIPAAALGGLAFPVCECGSIPVARRLIARGLHPSAGIVFMLAAPILNPVVLASTAIAYRGRGVALEMVLGRAGVGLLLAGAAGWALGARDEVALREVQPAEDHGERGRPRVAALADHLGSDLFLMGRFLVVGAALAALLQTLIPQGVVAGVARTPIVGALGMMALAFVLSLCSEADAFVAVSFSAFPLGAQLAFLVFGPALDAKLALLYGGTFRRRFVLRLLGVAVPVVLAGSLWFEVLVQ
ncbi:MAG TPA: permease, partial [Actinomycetota bacterium]|nr:permease [Actinomycetota bacterium]